MSRLECKSLSYRVRISYIQTNYHFGGEAMEGLGIFFGGFFGGLGIFFLGCGLMWFISLWSKK